MTPGSLFRHIVGGGLIALAAIFLFLAVHGCGATQQFKCTPTPGGPPVTQQFNCSPQP